VATIGQEQHRGKHDRNQRWARFERADLLARYGALHTQGVSQRQAARCWTCPAARCRRGGRTKSTLTSVLRSWRFFTVLRGLPSSIGSSWHCMWCVSRWEPAGFAWCAYP